MDHSPIILDADIGPNTCARQLRRRRGLCPQFRASTTQCPECGTPMRLTSK